MTMFGSGDIGWAGAFVPMIVGENTLGELRNLAGPPQHPGQKWIMVDLSDGAFKWYTPQRRTSQARRKSRRR